MSESGKRKHLGRGLSALFGDEPPENIPSAKLRHGGMLPIENLRSGEYQPRRTFDQDALKSLVDSVSQKGVLEPLLVRKIDGQTDHYEIVAGERRWRAAQTAGLHEVPVVVKKIGDREALEIALIENLQREDLTPIEEAEGYKRLMDQFKRTQENLAREIGKSRSHVANMIRLLSLPETVREKVQNGSLSAGHARALIAAADPAATAVLVIKKALNVRQTEALIRRERGSSEVTKRRGRPSSDKKDPNTIALERDVGNLLGLRVEIDDLGEAGKLIFHYTSLDQLDDILQRLTGGEEG